MKWINGIPYGLILCRINGESVTVTALTDEKLRVRRMGDEPIRSLDLRFLRSDFWGYVPDTPENWHILPAERDEYGLIFEIEVEDALFRNEVRRVLGLYAQYIRLKSSGDDEYAASVLAGCPYEDAESASPDEQKTKWFSSLEGFSLEGDWTLALSLDQPKRYKDFLSMPFADFQKRYFESGCLEKHTLFQKTAKRIYVGNAFCRRLNPDGATLAAIYAKARDENLEVTAVLPFLREVDVSWGEEQVLLLRALGAEEIVANDLGAVLLIHRAGIPEISLGVLMNRRRKDPRTVWKSGSREAFELLAETNLNDPEYRKWLADFGVRRIEYETCGTPVKLAPGKSSVHFPFYVTNTSHFCPLAAACKGLDPGRAVADCGQVCLDYARIYPDWMRLVGRYNSIFGCDTNALTDARILGDFVSQGADRLVVNLL